MIINGNLKFHTLGSGELQNAIIERLAEAPTGGGAVTGRLYYNTATNTYCYYNGSAWACFATGGNTGDLQTEIDNIETAVGLHTDGTFLTTPYAGATYITTPTSVANAIMQLDAAINSNNTLAELDDVALGSLVDGDVLQYDSGSPAGWKNVAIGSASGIQPYDAGLSALATGGTGIVSMSGDSVYFRTLTAPAAGITVTNGNGVADNPTLALADDLAAVEGLNTAGYAVRILSGSPETMSWATRSILGTDGNIVVSDGDGEAGNTVINLATLSIGTDGGSFWKFDYDTQGRVTKVKAVATADITALVGDTYVNVTGDTMTGQLIFAGSPQAGITLPTPSGGFTNANDVINKSYVDNLVSGISWKEPVDSVGTSLPGTATTGQRFLNTTDNKIYTATAPNTWDAGVSPSDNWAVFDKATDGAYTYNGGSPAGWIQFTGAGQINDGVGLTKVGNTLNVNLGAGIMEMPTDEIGVDTYSQATMALSFSVGGVRDDTPPTAGQLTLFVDATGGIKGGLGNAGTELALDFVSLPTLIGVGSPPDTVNGSTDFIAFYNNSAADHQTVTFNDLLQDLDVPYGITGTGLIARTGEDAYSSRTISIYGAGAYDGLYITDGNGVGGNPTVGLDITSLPAVSDGGSPVVTLSGNEEFAVYNPNQDGGAANVKATLSQISTFVQSDTTLDEISNVDVTGAADGSALVFDGTNWVDQKIYHLHTQSSANVTWSVTHDIGQQYCNVTVVDASDEVIIPQSIKFDSTTGLTITFNTAITGKAVVMGVA